MENSKFAEKNYKNCKCDIWGKGKGGLWVLFCRHDFVTDYCLTSYWKCCNYFLRIQCRTDLAHMLLIQNM